MRSTTPLICFYANTSVSLIEAIAQGKKTRLGDWTLKTFTLACPDCSMAFRHLGPSPWFHLMWTLFLIGSVSVARSWTCFEDAVPEEQCLGWGVWPIAGIRGEGLWLRAMKPIQSVCGSMVGMLEMSRRPWWRS